MPKTTPKWTLEKATGTTLTVGKSQDRLEALDLTITEDSGATATVSLSHLQVELLAKVLGRRSRDRDL